MIFEPITLKTLLYILLLSLLPLKIVFNCLLVEDIFNANWIYFAIYKEIFEIICIFEMNFNRTVYQIFSKIRKDMTNFNVCLFNFVWKINLYNVLFEKSFPTLFFYNVGNHSEKNSPRQSIYLQQRTIKSKQTVNKPF